MRVSVDDTSMMETEVVSRMASFIPSNEKFCSLDMLAEVASATLQSDPSLIPNYSLQRTKHVKVGNSFPRKSMSSCEKLTLDQIKSLSEKNLIEMFSEHECDEMKRNYSFQCFLIPEKCSQVFKSFGNETRARYKMKAHLLSHIKDLAAASDANDGNEVFMAEPLHVRRKRLKDMNQKSTRRKKKNKYSKGKKDNLEISARNHGDLNFWNDSLHLGATTENSNFNPASERVYNRINGEIYENLNDTDISESGNEFNYSLPYFHKYYSVCDSDADQVILKGQSNSNVLDTNFHKSGVKRKRSKQQFESRMAMRCKSEHNSSIKSSSWSSESSSHFNCDAHPESDTCLQVHHDHTYTSVDGKTLNDDKSSASENNRSVTKVFRDPFHPKKRTHNYLKKESPLIIPTPPFPYVYVPILPHIAVIQEVGVSPNFVDYDSFMESCYACTGSPKSVPLFIQSESESSKNFISQSESATKGNVSDTEDDENVPSDTYTEDMSEDGGSGERSNIKFPNSSFCMDDHLKPECPENLRAVEKV